STNASFDEAAKASFPSRQGVAAGDNAAPARVPVRDWGVASASRPPSRRPRRNPRTPRSSGTCSSQLPSVVLANPQARRALSPGRTSAPEGAVQCDPSLAGCPSMEACPLARVTSQEIDVTRTGAGLPELLSRDCPVRRRAGAVESSATGTSPQPGPRQARSGAHTRIASAAGQDPRPRLAGEGRSGEAHAAALQGDRRALGQRGGRRCDESQLHERIAATGLQYEAAD